MTIAVPGEERSAPAVGTRERYRARAQARTSRRPSSPRLGRLRPGARGASSVEYGLLIALIAAVLCVGLGVAIKTVFADTIICVVAEFQGTAASNPTCDVVAPNTVPGGPGGPGAPGGGPIPVSPTPTPTPSP
jgi:Flp pilus assembly pilin Flp